MLEVCRRAHLPKLRQILEEVTTAMATDETKVLALRTFYSLQESANFNSSAGAWVLPDRVIGVHIALDTAQCQFLGTLGHGTPPMVLQLAVANLSIGAEVDSLPDPDRTEMSSSGWCLSKVGPTMGGSWYIGSPQPGEYALCLSFNLDDNRLQDATKLNLIRNAFVASMDKVSKVLT